MVKYFSQKRQRKTGIIDGLFYVLFVCDCKLRYWIMINGIK